MTTTTTPLPGYAPPDTPSAARRRTFRVKHDLFEFLRPEVQV